MKTRKSPSAEYRSCEKKQIEVVIRFGHARTIPVYAQKPVDKKKKSEQTKSNLNHGML